MSLRSVTQIFFILVMIASIAWVILISPPIAFDEGVIVTITKGESVKEIARHLKQSNIIQSEVLFTNLVVFSNLDSRIVAGDYAFDTKSNMLGVIKRISSGDYNIEAKRVTIPEGTTIVEMSRIFADMFYNITPEDFMNVASTSEGYLFPDTYYFPENVRSDEIVQKLKLTFDEKIAEHPEILRSVYSLADIVTMASIIEKEATRDSMQEVSDILWGRIEAGMALQVDAGFVYERGKHTFELSREDLMEDSPYNTYTNKGLTPTPISNPGLQALLAAAFPQPTDNVYFLTGYDGEMYYAQTLKEHEENKDLYLVAPQDQE